MKLVLSSRLRIVIIAVALGGTTATIGYSAATQELFTRTNVWALALAMGVAWACAVLAFVLLLRVGPKKTLVLVFTGSLLIGGASLAGPPNLSTDSARYSWDGIVQNAGVSPYAHAPNDPSLNHLRPTWLFPPSFTNAEGQQRCRGTRIERTTEHPSGATLCTALNRPSVPTIYPPVAEAYFAAVRFFVPRTVTWWPMQLGGLILSLVVTGMLALGLRARKLNPAWAAVWGWSPFVSSEAVNNSHVDVLGVAFLLAATFLAAPALTSRLAGATRMRPVLVGIGIGLAAAVKFVPALAAPPLLRRSPIRVVLAAVITFAVVYVPYVLVTGWNVIGYLPGYLDQEGYDDGSRFALISLVLHGTAGAVAAVALIAIAIALAWWRADPAQPWVAQLMLVGTVLIIVSPRYEWYALLVVPLVALSRRWEWLAIPIALTIRTLYPYAGVNQVGMAAAALVVIVGSLLRWRAARGRRATSASQLASTDSVGAAHSASPLHPAEEPR